MDRRYAPASMSAAPRSHRRGIAVSPLSQSLPPTRRHARRRLARLSAALINGIDHSAPLLAHLQRWGAAASAVQRAARSGISLAAARGIMVLDAASSKQDVRSAALLSYSSSSRRRSIIACSLQRASLSSASYWPLPAASGTTLSAGGSTMRSTSAASAAKAWRFSARNSCRS